MSFLTSITCKLTPSTSNLGKVEATASKLLFTMRPVAISCFRSFVLVRYRYVAISCFAKQALEQELRATLLVRYNKQADKLDWNWELRALAAAEFWWRNAKGDADEFKKWFSFGGHDAIKGSRNILKILIASDIKQEGGLSFGIWLFR